MAKRKPAKPSTPEVCPVCGDDVPRGALACPDCGADHQSGWREDADADGGEENFDYDSFVKAEFGSSIKPATLSMFWWVAAVLVTAAVIILYLRSGGF